MAEYTLDETIAAAKAQKGILWCILGNVAGVLFYWPILVAVLPFQIYFVYKLAISLRMVAPLVWCIAMFIPLVSLLLLLVLSQRATKAIRQKGVKVGLMGARIADLEALEPLSEPSDA